MKLARRLTAFVLGLAMLQLSASRASAMCAPSDSREQGSGQTSHHGADHHSHQTPPPSNDGATQPLCCQALASCTIVFGASSAVDAGTLDEMHGVVPALAIERPASLSTAPDTPPPRS